MNAQDPTTPSIECVVEFSGYGHHIAVQGRYGSGAVSGFGATGGLYVIDILDRALPVEVTHYGTSFDKLALRGGTDHGLDAATGLNLVDITSPINPTTLSVRDPDGFNDDLEGTSGPDPRNANSFPFIPAVRSFTGWGLAALAGALAATGRHRLSRRTQAADTGCVSRLPN
ncbi:MAG: hypothetical protein VCB43_09500 [Myxococcota bacterium]